MISRNSIVGAYPTKLLGDVVEFLDSVRRPITESERRAGPYPYYGANGQQGTIDDFIFDEPLVLLAEDGGYFGTPDRGIAYRVAGRTWVNNHAHVLRPKADMDLGYLYRILEHYDVTPWVTGTTRGKLTQAGASQIVVPVPPLPEQRRIAEILDKADALRAKRRAALAQLDTLTQSIFLEMFGDLVTNPKQWPVVCFASAVYFQEGPGVRNWQFRNEGIKLINVKNIVDGRLVIENTDRYLSPDEVKQRYQHFLLDTGDLVVASSGVTWGKIAEVAAEHLPLCLNTSMIRLRPLSVDIEKPFIRAFVESPAFRKQILRLITGSAQPNFGPAHLEQVRIPLPSLAVQREFARRVSAVEGLKTHLRESAAKLDALFAMLQHRAFRGDL